MAAQAVTVHTIIKGAMKKLHVLAEGREPSAAQATDGLGILQALYREFVGQGVFGRLQDVLVKTATYSARENERVVCNFAGVVTVTLPVEITSALVSNIPFSYSEGGTDYGRGVAGYDNLPRPPRDGSCIVVADVNSDFGCYFIYEANRARWIVLDDLVLGDNAPLSGRYEEALKSILAVRWASHFGKEPAQHLVAQANTGRYSLSMKIDRGYRPVEASYF